MNALLFHRGPRLRAGFTLLEVIVVLIILAAGVALVGPSLLSLPEDARSPVTTLVIRARESAVRRGEIVRLRIDRSGAWQAVAGSAPRSTVLLSGRIDSPPPFAVDLVFSPLGTCGPSLASVPPEALAALDPLTCEPRPS